MPVIRSLLLLLGLAALFSTPAQAAPACTVGATSVAFGAYDYQSPAAQLSQGTITVSCQEQGVLDLDTLVNYSLSLSTGNSGSYSNRELAGGTADTLLYNLYSDTIYTLIWGDGSGGSNTVDSSLLVPGCVLILGCSTVSNNHIVYARVPAGQIVSPDNYSDSILVTLSY